jgi:hypothetical protein
VTHRAVRRNSRFAQESAAPFCLRNFPCHPVSPSTSPFKCNRDTLTGPLPYYSTRNKSGIGSHGAVCRVFPSLSPLEWNRILRFDLTGRLSLSLHSDRQVHACAHLSGHALSCHLPGQGTRSAGVRRSHHAVEGWLRGPRRRWHPGPLGAEIGPCAMGLFGSMRRRTSRFYEMAAAAA